MKPILPALCLSLLCLAASLSTARVHAQTAALDPMPAADVWDTTEIVVTGRFPGPALWRVRRGESEVYIIGAMPVMTKHAQWDMARIGRILAMSNVFLTAPQAKGGVISFTRWQMDKTTGPFTTVYKVLPAPVAARFRRIVAANSLNEKDYARDSPVYAAMKLRDDVYAKHGISTNDPEKMMIFLARDRKTPMRPMIRYSASKVLGKLDNFSKAERTECVTAILDEVEFAVTHVKAATAAWAVGDLNGAHANSPNSATLACLSGTGASEAMLDTAVDDAVDAIDTALKTPGKSVIVFPLSVLLRQDGALKRLRATGAEISEPQL